MRVPTMERRSFRLRAWIIGFVVVLVVLLFSLRGLAGFYTDYLWFDSLGQGGTWRALLGAKVVPAVVFTAVFFVIMLASLLIADRLAPKVRPMGPASPEDELVNRYQQVAGRYQGRIRVAISAFFALIAGIGVSSQWRNWVLFMHRVDFGVKDPQFHKDVGFYVFQLPFIQFILDWLFAGLVIVLLVTAVAHYLNGGIRFQSPLQRVTPQVKAHLSVIVAVMALVKTAQYYFSRFGLTLSGRGVVDGATYTDVKAQLPALNLLIFISIVAAGLFLWNIFRRGWVLPVIAIGLWGFVSIVVGTIYPAAIQNFRVKPNELAQERPYIGRNIAATRTAFGLGKVDTKPFDFTQFSDVPDAATVVDSNKGTINNARLWDPNVIQSTYNNLQKIQTYYQIGDVDVDRYLIGNETRQVLIAARGLNSADLPSQSFVNRHIVYTHGYGLVASPSNQADSDGTPDYYLSDIPPASDGISLAAGKPAEIYFGEGLSSYVLVGGKSNEFNYAAAGKTDKFTRYQGKDGVKLSNIIRKAAFALRFGDFNPLISGQVTSKTKVLLERDIRDRASKLAPFLRFDADPYPVVLKNKDGVGDGRVHHHRSLSLRPVGYRRRRSGHRLQLRAQLGEGHHRRLRRHRHLLRVRPEGPDHPRLAQGVPRLVHRCVEDVARVAGAPPLPRRSVPRSLRSSAAITSPKRALLRRQRQVAGLARSRSGAVSAADLTGSGSAQSSSNQPQAASSSGKRIDPYYLYLRLPGDTTEHFIVVEPFVPVSSGNSITRLVSFLTAKADPGDYGELQSFVMPQGGNVFGPVQVDNEINRTGSISSAVSLLNKEGSSVIRGACSSSRSATRSSTCGRSTCRARGAAASRSSSSSRCSPRGSRPCVPRR